jgi:hypothetical protein
MRTLIVLCLLIASVSKAEVAQTLEMSNRTRNKTGVTSGFGNPFPSILGLNLGYHLNDFLKGTVGYGELSVSSGESKASVRTLGAGADVFVPGWSLTPTAGLHISKVDVSNSGGAELSVQGIEESTTMTYAQAGFDWQAQGGFNLGIGAVAGLTGAKASGSYMNLGWFF